MAFVDVAVALFVIALFILLAEGLRDLYSDIKKHHAAISRPTVIPPVVIPSKVIHPPVIHGAFRRSLDAAPVPGNDVGLDITSTFIHNDGTGAGPMRLSKRHLEPRFDNVIEQHHHHGGSSSWKRYALKVTHKYDSNTWLGGSGAPGSWLMSYHGTTYQNALSIVREGFKLEKGKRFAHGRGVYTTPNISTAEQFARAFTHERERYIVVVQSRVNPANIRMVSDYWISPGNMDVCPYGLCLKKI